jgi:hypothetical protein
MFDTRKTKIKHHPRKKLKIDSIEEIIPAGVLKKERK